jgi:hypothetical protein
MDVGVQPEKVIRGECKKRALSKLLNVSSINYIYSSPNFLSSLNCGYLSGSIAIVMN